MRALQASVVLLSVLFCYCQCYCLLLLLLVLLLKCQKMLYLCSCLAHKFAPNCERREFLKQTQLTVAPKFVSISLWRLVWKRFGILDKKKLATALNLRYECQQRSALWYCLICSEYEQYNSACFTSTKELYLDLQCNSVLSAASYSYQQSYKMTQKMLKANTY